MKRRAWQALVWLLHHGTPTEWRRVADAIREAQGSRLAAEALTPLTDLPWHTITSRHGRLYIFTGAGQPPRSQPGHKARLFGVLVLCERCGRFHRAPLGLGLADCPHVDVDVDVDVSRVYPGTAIPPELLRLAATWIDCPRTGASFRVEDPYKVLVVADGE